MGGLSVAVVVVTAAGAVVGMMGAAVASVATVAVASVLLTVPGAPTVVGDSVGGAGGEM